MNFLVQAILPYVLLYKYTALFIITFFASSAVPIPAGTLLITSSVFASQGFFNILTIFIVVIIANIAGDNTLYWLSRLYGKRLLSHINFFRKILISKNFALIEKGIQKHPGLIIFISRFEVISTLTVNLICGLSKVEYKKYFFYEVTGSFASVLFYSAIGYLFGNNWQTIDKLIGNFSIVLFLLIILGVSLFWRRIMSKLNKEE